MLFMRLHGYVLDARQRNCESLQCLARNRRRKLGLILSSATTYLAPAGREAQRDPLTRPSPNGPGRHTDPASGRTRRRPRRFLPATGIGWRNAPTPTFRPQYDRRTSETLHRGTAVHSTLIVPASVIRERHPHAGRDRRATVPARNRAKLPGSRGNTPYPSGRRFPKYHARCNARSRGP